MRDFVAPSPLPRGFHVRSLSFSLRCSHHRRGFVRSQLFGTTNGFTLINHYLIPRVRLFSHRKWHDTISSKVKCPRLNCGGFLCSVSPRSSSAETSFSSNNENPSTFEPLEVSSGLRSSFGRRKAVDGNEAPALSLFDLLELKRELEEEKNARAGSLEEESRPEDSEEKISGSEKEEAVVGGYNVKGEKRMMRRSNFLAKQVISMASARSLGFVSQLWVDTRSWMVALVEVRPNFLSGDAEKFLLEDVYQVGDVVLVPDESVVENEIKMTGLESLVGYDVVKLGRRSIGKIRGYTFNINTGSVEALEFDSFGFSIIPSSLVSTYLLSVEDVLDVECDKIIVHEQALSRVQRLTKGIWDSGNLSKSRSHLEASRDFRRRRAYADRTRSSQILSNPKFTDEDDDWDLPMEY